MKKALLVITGSIAACRAPEMIRSLQKAGFLVWTTLTTSARSFVTPEVLSAFSHHPVLDDALWHSPFAASPFSFSQNGEKGASCSFLPLALAQQMDVFVVAPATAETLFRLAHGASGTLAETALLATKKPILLAPAMNSEMLHHPAVQANLHLLQKRGVIVLPTDFGELACGSRGSGKLLNPDHIAAFALRSTTFPDFLGKKVLVTLGATYESIDPVRGITNRSSGKMGIALATSLWRRGADVFLVAGKTTDPIPSFFSAVSRIESAEEMKAHCFSLLPSLDMAFFCAAVSDFSPETPSKEKLSSREIFSPLWKKSPDISALCGAKKKPGQYFFSFSLGGTRKQALEKMKEKCADGIFWNPLSALGETASEITLFFQNDTIGQQYRENKEVLSEIILQEVSHRFSVSEKSI